MKYNIYLFFVQFVIFFNQNKFVSTLPMLGQNVRQARSGQFPYVASIMRIVTGSAHSNGEHICSGVIITRKDVLTSAHCVEGEIMNLIQIVIGTIDLRNGQVYYPFWWETYNQWAESYNLNTTYQWNDLVNIRILISVPNHILPARLSSLSNTDLYGANVIMAGWGLNNDHIIPDILNIANLEVIENVVCETKIERIIGMRVPIDQRALCTFIRPYVLIDQGDSGGPLIFRNRLVGINKGVCPTSVLPIQDSQVNIHVCIDSYRNYINYMKNQ